MVQCGQKKKNCMPKLTGLMSLVSQFMKAQWKLERTALLPHYPKEKWPVQLKEIVPETL